MRAAEVLSEKNRSFVKDLFENAERDRRET